MPSRYDTLAGLPPGSIGSDGRGAAQILAYDALERGDIVKEVSNWYSKSTGHRLNVTFGAFNGKELFSLNLMPKMGKSRGIELVDTGEGMGQVLPIITLLSLSKHDRLNSRDTILFEHPELHLHPAAHAPLASFFCDVASTPNCPRMIVETHSENFLLRIQLAIATGQLPPSRAVIYWIHQTSSGEALADKITFDDLGQPEGDRWPPGLFSENVEQSREIVLARKRRRDR